MLEVRQLHISRGAKPVIHGVDLNVAPGEIVALLGPNGAGKSSIVLALAGAIPRSLGQITMGGVPMDGLAPEELRRSGLAIVPEGHHVLGSLSVHDNLRAAALVLPANEVDPAIERVLMTFSELKPMLDYLGRSLSGGQKQMVCMAQALLAQPKILVVDELSLGLSPLIVKRLADVLQRVAADGVGVLLIEQFTTLALRLSQRAIVLQRGRIAWSGSARTLQDSPEILQASYLA